jgi:DNA-binding LytR/AlgR family response regulator
MKPVTALIADDEPALADYLEDQLRGVWPQLQIIAKVNNGLDALRLIDELAPDFAFLDIRMPGLSGLDVATRLIDRADAPKVVFVTAYDQYAVDAFERAAADYLLKPASLDRLRKTVARLRQASEQPLAETSNADLLTRLAGILNQTAIQPRLEWIRAAHGNETRLLSVDEVIYFEARDKYVSVFTLDSELLIRTPLKELIASLDPERFWQIHRGTLVAVRHIAGTTRDLRGRTVIKLKARNETLPVSRAYLHLFKQM